MTLIETVYEAIREAIVQGRYAPGSRLKAEHLRLDFGVSGTIVREALSRLLADGLVTANDRRGFSVAPFSAADLNEIIEARLLIEVEVVRQSVARGGDDWETALVGLYHRLSKLEKAVDPDNEDSLRQLEAANRAFHDQLGAACPSETLKGFYSQLFTRHYRYRRIALRTNDVLKPARADHDALLHAALARDAARAAAITRTHIERTRNFADWIVEAFGKAKVQA